MRDAGNIGSGSAVAVVVHHAEVGGCPHGGEKRSIPSKMFVVLEKHLAIVQECSCSDVEIEFPAHPKRKIMLQGSFQLIEVCGQSRSID